MNKRTPKYTYFLQVVIGSLFIASSISKLFLIPAVGREIQAYQVVPDSLVVPATICLVICELVLGVWLLTNRGLKYSCYSLIGLLSIFIIAKTSAVIRGIEISCNACFGTFLSLPLWANMILNVSLILALYYISVKSKTIPAFQSKLDHIKYVYQNGKLSEDKHI